MLSFWQNPSFLSQFSLREDSVRDEPFPGARTVSGIAPRAQILPTPSSLQARKCPKHIPGGNSSRIQAPSPRC